jgi:transposase-like protein
MHASDPRRTGKSGRNTDHKTAVLGFRERGGAVRAEVVPDVSTREIQPRVRETVESGSTVYTDAWKSYTGLEADYAHEVIDHAETYVNGRVHTNGIENFWSLLKRGLHGTYISVEPFHLFRYLDERAFTYNLRDAGDASRFETVLAAITGRRLTYAALTGC